MAITLNGSTGITSPGGDTSTSLSTGLLTVTGSTAPTNGLYLPTTNTLAWATNSTRNMTLDTSGNLLVGTTSQINSCKVGVLFDEQVYIGLVLKSSNATTGGSYQYFVNSSGALAGNIAHTGATTVAYNASSDQRLKENITDAPSALDSVNAIKVRSFDWKEDKLHVDYGYIAQELIEVVPEAVYIPADPEEMMGVDFGKLTPRLVKSIQELTARLEALEGAK